MQIKHLTLFIILFLVTIISFAQRGKDGAKVITTTEVVNAYTMLSADANAGATSIAVNNSSLSTNFSNPLAQGDLIMIYQVQGVSIEDTVASPNANSSKFFPSWGRITNYNNTGNYELVQVASVPNATTINLDCPLSLNYTASGRVLIIRVPRYTSLTINNGGVLTTTTWNATSGGVLAIEVLGQTTINSGGKIDVTGLGFRGGIALTTSFTTVFGGLRYADSNQAEGAEKGEGIAGDQSIYATFNAGGAGYCRGAAANAGGGGNAHNAGGGGGANAGNLNTWNNGVGNPDISNVNFVTAWNLEPILSSSTISSGGGRGGYSILKNNRNELTTPPNNSLWGGDNRGIVGGLGGRPLDYSTGKIFMGGGGGAGDGDNAFATNGGNGGGIIFLSTYDDITGAGKIIAHGANGVDINPGSAGFGQLAGGDAPGGAGGGGAIILKTTGNVSITDSIAANGGNGGNQVLVAGTFASIDEGQGPGGGGGGGYIAISAGTPNRFANGGMNGITNSPYVSQFPPNGATMGGVGLPNEIINSFDILVNDDSTCSNSTATLTASLTGTPPSGTTIEWFDAEFNGNLVNSGASFTTPALTVNTTYWVRVCPAPYLVPVTAYVVPCNFPVAALSASDSTICINDCISFTDLSTGTPTNWSWYFFGSSTPTSSQQNPTNICYPTTGTFDVALVVSNTNGTDSIFMSNFITVNPLPTVIASNDTTICNGSSATITASGASTYAWDNGIGAGQSHTVTPTSTTTYTVTGTDANGCQNTDNVIITVNPLPIVVTSNDTTICNGSSAIISASGATSYTWDNGLGAGQLHTVNPTITTTYVVTGTDVNGCQNTDNVIVTVTNCGTPPTASFSASDSTICINECINFTDLSSSIPSGWSWYFFGSSTPTSSQQNPTNICYPSAGTFDVALVATNSSGSDSIFISNFITVNPLPTVVASNDTAICNGSSATISALGASSYSWNNGLGAGQSYTVSPTTTTTYVVTGIDVNGCQNTDNVIITVNPLPTIVASNDTTICNGSSATISASGASTYSWDNGLGAGQLHTVNPTTTTTYAVTGTDANGCQNTDNIIVTVVSCGVPTANLSANNTAICINDCVDFTDLSTNTPTSWLWSFEGVSPATSTLQHPQGICYDSTGTFDVTLIVSNAFGFDTITMNNYIVVDSCLEVPVSFTIPNVFSPNNDGNNDVFFIESTGVTNLDMQIYNRWGMLIFETSDIKATWDGRTNSGDICPEGTYFYIIKITTDKTETFKGTLTLLR
ncbi:MAG: gliding motility-associated C-terminal domain-containing protein [Vicingaceae bacterium]|nr:gliding motility-associated C-terminal domain-containing protein [Vicingaceae bacterium]